MLDDAVGDGELADRHLPFVRRRLQQHRARRRATLAHILVRRANAAAAAGRHVAPDAVAGEVLARRRILPLHLFPVALELLADELGKAGERALAHLRAGDANDHVLVGLDDNPGADLAAFRAQHVLRQRIAKPGHIDAQSQTAAGGRAGHQELAPRELRVRCCSCHGTPPQPLLPAAEAARVPPAAM